MLQRIYVNNFRCLVNFELKLNQINLLLGSNGSGKSSIFDVLGKIQDFVSGDARIYDLFSLSDTTRWQTLDKQRFEVDIALGEEYYSYQLLLERDTRKPRIKVEEETLLLNGKPLFSFRDGTARLYGDDHSEGPSYPFDLTLSGVGFVDERPNQRCLARFKQALEKVILVRPLPALMRPSSDREEARLVPTMENFVSWYRRISQEHGRAVMDIHEALRQVLPEFHSLDLKVLGETSKILRVNFQPAGDGRLVSFDFSELSDGQKMLIALYTLVFGLKDKGISLFVDEPDNFVTLREIQPWLLNLLDACGDWIEQTVLISHHPELINYLVGDGYGRWLTREGTGAVRILENPKFIEGLSVSETMARGWEQ